jgi:hypothetical protein
MAHFSLGYQYKTYASASNNLHYKRRETGSSPDKKIWYNTTRIVGACKRNGVSHNALQLAT